VVSSINPYEAPRASQGGPILPDDERTLTATFVADRALLMRAVYFDVERHTAFTHIIFSASIITMTILTFLLILRRPFTWAFAMVMVFVVLLGLQTILPYVWARIAVRKYVRTGKWPLTSGENQIRVSLDTLQITADEKVQRWHLREIADGFYLFDVLLIRPDPGIMLLIPRTADFGTDSFNTFCQTFIQRYRNVREN